MCVTVWMWSRVVLKEAACMLSKTLPWTNVPAVCFILWDAPPNQCSPYQISQWESVTQCKSWLESDSIFSRLTNVPLSGAGMIHYNGQAAASYRTIDLIVCSLSAMLMIMQTWHREGIRGHYSQQTIHYTCSTYCNIAFFASCLVFYKRHFIKNPTRTNLLIKLLLALYLNERKLE